MFFVVVDKTDHVLVSTIPSIRWYLNPLLPHFPTVCLLNESVNSCSYYEVHWVWITSSLSGDKLQIWTMSLLIFIVLLSSHSNSTHSWLLSMWFNQLKDSTISSGYLCSCLFRYVTSSLSGLSMFFFNVYVVVIVLAVFTTILIAASG